jgi:hypothetical protein
LKPAMPGRLRVFQIETARAAPRPYRGPIPW